MESTYDDIVRFMGEYFMTYSEYGQHSFLCFIMSTPHLLDTILYWQNYTLVEQTIS